MGKGKKGGKRMNKAQLTEKLHDFFASQPGVTLSFKEIFRALHLDTHPLKMLAIDIMEEMAWDDYLAKVSDNSYRLNQSIQVMEGKFVRKPNGKNSVIPEGSEKPIFVSERNSMGALSGDLVGFSNRQSFYAAFFRLNGVTPRDYRKTRVATLPSQDGKPKKRGRKAGSKNKPKA